MKTIPALFFFLPLVFLACKADPSVDAGQPQEIIDPGPVELIVNIDDLRMRDAPGENAEVVATLKLGDALTDLGEISSFTSRITLRGVPFDEPWIKASTADGKTGWVYGGGVHFQVNDSQALTAHLLKRRLTTLFGENLAGRVDQYRREYREAQTSSEFASLYQSGKALRDTLIQILTDKVLVNPVNDLPDMYWLEQAMPGFVAQLVAEGTAYYLFWDYRQLLEKTSATAGAEDEAFIQVCLKAHRADSIEYFFPAWFLQTWDYGGHSELGKGVHLSILQKIQSTLSQSPLFEKELLSIKSDIVADITNPENTYWWPQADILRELKAILEENFSILTEPDKIALRTRLQQFEQADKNGIKMDHRSGKHDQ